MTQTTYTPLIQKGDAWKIQVRANSRKYKTVLELRDGHTAEIIMLLKYDPMVLQLEWFVLEKPIGKTDMGGKVYAGNIREVSQDSGQVHFQCIRQMKTSIEWNGLIVSVRFKALRTGNTDITLS